MKAVDMQTRIELELRGKDSASIKELNLDNCRATQIEGLTDDFQSLETLSLINIGLTTLKGFPNLPNLKKLELSDNRISNGINFLLGCLQLTHLNLSGNKIKELEVLGPLAKLEKLTHLDLFNCEITQLAEYRDKVFKLLPHLKYLDGFDKNDQEDEEECDEEDDDDDEDEDDDEEEVEAVEEKNGAGAAAEEEEDDEDDDDDEDDEDDEEEEENEVGLSYLQKSNLSDEEDDADFDEKKAMKKAEEEEDEEDEEEDEEIDDEELNEVEGGEENGAAADAAARKRKHSGEEH